MRRTLPPVPQAGLGRARKVALVGNAPTWTLAPFDDPSWEIWSHCSTQSLARRVDRFFDLHPRPFWEQGKKWHVDYVTWLKSLTVPVLMQKAYADIPAAIAYPKDRVLSEFRPYFTSQTAWMIALALIEGVTHLGFFGVHYAHYSEYASQRAGCEYWMGVAEGRGVQLVLPPTNPLLQQPSRLYGYESHEEGKLHASYRYTPTPKETATAGLTISTLGPESPPLRVLDEPVAWERSGLPRESWQIAQSSKPSEVPHESHSPQPA